MQQGRYPHWQQGLVSIIIPVLELKRSRRLRYPLAIRRNIADLLSDLEKITDVDLEIIVICNSRDEELVRLVTTDSRIDKYCLNSVNVGVARSWNMGAMMAEGEFLCFSNDDVEVGPGSIESLSRVISENQAIGQVGPQGAMWPGLAPGEYVGLEVMEAADAISGYFFITRRTAFDEAGGFDVAFTPAGAEEIDYSFNIRSMGYTCMVVPGLAISHHGKSGVSSRNTKIAFLGKESTTVELNERNMRILKSKWIRR
ncbi:MAG: glycosyltransferase family 2 protein [Thermoleophilia bacterium]